MMAIFNFNPQAHAKAPLAQAQFLKYRRNEYGNTSADTHQSKQAKA
jgi:hypothetical protein